ncbi:hypothetical protein VQ056_21045 [Paenibacillus sp. JTLBN-2024]
MNTDSSCLETRKVYRSFLGKLLRNYLIGLLLTVLVVGSAIVPATLSIAPGEYKRLAFVLLVSLVSMGAAEWIFLTAISAPSGRGLPRAQAWTCFAERSSKRSGCRC